MHGRQRVEGVLHPPSWPGLLRPVRRPVRRRMEAAASKEGPWRMPGLRRVEGAWRMPGRRRVEGAWRMPGLRRWRTAVPAVVVALRHVAPVVAVVVGDPIVGASGGAFGALRLAAVPAVVVALGYIARGVADVVGDPIPGAGRGTGLRRGHGAWRMPGRRRVEGAWRMPGLRRQERMSCAARLRSPACAELGAACAVAAAVAVVVLRHAIAEDGVRGHGRLASGINVSAHDVEQLGKAGKPAKPRCNRTL